jgi:hypothetical protein
VKPKHNPSIIRQLQIHHDADAHHHAPHECHVGCCSRCVMIMLMIVAANRRSIKKKEKRKKEEARSSIPVPTTLACPDLSVCLFCLCVLELFFLVFL